MSGRAYSLCLVGAVLCGLALTLELVKGQADWDRARTDRAAAQAAIAEAAAQRDALEQVRAALRKADAQLVSFQQLTQRIALVQPDDRGSLRLQVAP